MNTPDVSSAPSLRQEQGVRSEARNDGANSSYATTAMNSFAPGDRVELIRTTDPYTHLSPGDAGIVRRIDRSLGHLEIAWDSGSHLSMIPGQGDVVRKV